MGSLIGDKVFKRLLATIEIARPHNMVATAGCVLSAFYLTGGSNTELILVSAIVTALVTGLGNLVNDFFDADIDGINKPRRPIPSGRLSRAYVFRLYAAGTALLTLFIVFFLPVPVMSLMLIWEVLLFYYAASAKRVALLGNLIVAGVCASAFVIGAMATGAYIDVLFPACVAFTLVLGRELVKGAEDVEGDMSVGARDTGDPFRRRARRALERHAPVAVRGRLAAPRSSSVYGRLYTVLALLLVVPGLLSAAYLVLKYPGKAMFNRASWILKFDMLVGIVVFGLGRV